MAQANNFGRNDCQVGNKRLTYETLTREWRCSNCGKRLVMLGSVDDERYPKNWHVECVACGGVDFIHEYEAARQRRQARRIDRVYGSIIDQYMKNKEKNDNQGTD